MNCPTCGGPDTRPIANIKSERGGPDPGETCIYTCDEGQGCENWIDVVPEPTEDYQGDGVFAANH